MPVFDYGQQEVEHLIRRDKKLGEAIKRIGRLEREVIPDLFTALINSIVSQQISSKAALTVWNRLQNKLADINARTIYEASPDVIQECGLSIRKVGYMKGIAEAVLQNELDLSALSHLPDHEIIVQLSQLKGVGVWTAEMLLIFSLQRPDVVSWGDQGIRRGMMNLYGLNNLGKEQFDRYRKRYSPYGSVASLYLWEIARQN